MSSEKVKVLYIGGSGRSGSTLLAAVLGEAPGVFDAGELRYLWQRGLVEGRQCGCGQPIPECPVWCAVLEAAFGSVSAAPVADVVAVQRRVNRIRHVPAVLAHADAAELEAYRATLAQLYTAIQEVTRCSLIIDSSKLPTYALVLDAVPSIEMHFVHLVRDPRATAFSWMRTKSLGDGGARSHMERFGPVKSAVLWSVWNTVASQVRRRVESAWLLRYEDFVTSPRDETARLLAFAGCDVAVSFLDEHSLKLGPNHTVAGNADRFRTGLVNVRGDTEWVTRMRVTDRALVTMLTAFVPTPTDVGHIESRPTE